MVATSKTFRPPLWGTVGLLLTGAVCISAGFWQMDRAEQKSRLFAAYETTETGESLHELVDNSAIDELRYHRVAVSGRYDGKRQVLLDNMTHAGRAGYLVLTPLRVGGTSVLVNRGWVPADPDRRKLPSIDVDDDLREVSGRLNRLPRPGVRLEGVPPDRNAPWPRRLLYPTASDLSAQLGYIIYDYQIMLDKTERDGFAREWKPVLMSPEKHRGYAIQWFALAFTALVIYLVVNWKPRKAIEEND